VRRRTEDEQDQLEELAAFVLVLCVALLGWVALVTVTGWWGNPG
jgi:hypothetical protein